MRDTTLMHDAAWLSIWYVIWKLTPKNGLMGKLWKITEITAWLFLHIAHPSFVQPLAWPLTRRALDQDWWNVQTPLKNPASINSTFAEQLSQMTYTPCTSIRPAHSRAMHDINSATFNTGLLSQVLQQLTYVPSCHASKDCLHAIVIQRERCTCEAV